MGRNSLTDRRLAERPVRPPCPSDPRALPGERHRSARQTVRIRNPACPMSRRSRSRRNQPEQRSRLEQPVRGTSASDVASTNLSAPWGMSEMGTIRGSRNADRTRCKSGEHIAAGKCAKQPTPDELDPVTYIASPVCSLRVTAHSSKLPLRRRRSFLPPDQTPSSRPNTPSHSFQAFRWNTNRRESARPTLGSRSRRHCCRKCASDGR